VAGVVRGGVLDRTPRERLLAVFDIRAPPCPFIAAAVEMTGGQ
jgi:hypothetical protein